MDQEKASHVNAVTLCFRDSDKERQVTIQYVNTTYNISISLSLSTKRTPT